MFFLSRFSLLMRFSLPSVSLALFLICLSTGSAHADNLYQVSGTFESTDDKSLNIEKCTANEEIKINWTITGGTGGASQVTYQVLAGSNCSSFDASGCVKLVGTSNYTGSQNLTTTFKAQDLFSANCAGFEGSTSGVLSIYFCVNDPNPPPDGGVAGIECHAVTDTINYTLVRPTAPTDISIGVDEGELEVSWSANDVSYSKYRIYYTTVAGLMNSGDIPPSSCAASHTSGIDCTSTVTSTAATIGGLSNGVSVYVAVTGYDNLGNESPFSVVSIGTPSQIQDFWEYYKSRGGMEPGGYCFIATATYGSYQHNYVKVLRNFRDQVLKKSEFGRSLVDFYYQWSPALAEVIQDTPFLKVLVRILLWPVIALAWLWINTSLVVKFLLLLALILAFRYGRRGFGILKQKLGARTAVALLVATAISLGAGASLAETPRTFHLEVKFGPFKPDIDKKVFNNGATPFADVFGDSNRLMTQIEFEWLIWKKFGTLGLSCGIGFYQAVGKGYLEGTTTKAGSSTVLNIIPLTLQAVYRFDALWYRWKVPFVPYAKLGFSYNIWWVLNSSGEVAKTRGLSGNGGIFGLRASFGIQFLLDVFDKRMAQTFDFETGVNHTYIFAEFVISRADDFWQSGLNFSDEYFLFGVAFEF